VVAAYREDVDRFGYAADVERMRRELIVAAALK
jgi:hypothetical protein